MSGTVKETAASLHDDGRPASTVSGGHRVTPDPTWRDQAACRGLDVDLFFPPRNGNVTLEAKVTCDRCPVRQACLLDALETHEDEYGIRGGLTPEQRRALVKRNGVRRLHLHRAGLRLVTA